MHRRAWRHFFPKCPRSSASRPDRGRRRNGSEFYRLFLLLFSVWTNVLRSLTSFLRSLKEQTTLRPRQRQLLPKGSRFFSFDTPGNYLKISMRDLRDQVTRQGSRLFNRVQHTTTNVNIFSHIDLKIRAFRSI